MPLIYETKGHIGYFRIENGKVNVFDPPMHREFLKALKRFESDPEVKVGVISGAGEKAFSAGDDMKFEQRLAAPAERLERHFFPEHHNEKEMGYPGDDRAAMAFRRRKPVIAAVNGWCLGRGLMYLLHHSDIRIAGASAKFGFPEISFGMGGTSGLTLIQKHLPRNVALEMVLTGKPIDAKRAEAVHLINHVVPDEDVMRFAEEIAAGIAEHPASAIRTEMESYLCTENLDHDTGLAVGEHIYRLQRLVTDVKNSDVEF